MPRKSKAQHEKTTTHTIKESGEIQTCMVSIVFTPNTRMMTP